MHKIAIFSDELENVKQLNFSLQKFESDNIEFEKSVLICIIIYRNLSNQLDSLKDTNSRLIDYVKSINKKVGTRIVEKSFRKLQKITNQGK